LVEYTNKAINVRGGRKGVKELKATGVLKQRFISNACTFTIKLGVKLHPDRKDAHF
jgi:hypothetical protein